MKKVALVFITVTLCVLFNSSCKKDAPTNTAKSPVGKWQWIDTYKDVQLSDSNPLTPQNTGTQELLTFNTDHTFKHLINNIAIDSGTFSYGHGTFINLSNTKFEYDSILYYHKGVPVVGGVDYYTFYTDTLSMNPGLADQWLSYSVSNFGGSKFWQKQQ